jgi:hypothetical protein
MQLNCETHEMKKGVYREWTRSGANIGLVKLKQISDFHNGRRKTPARKPDVQALMCEETRMETI